jgi:hypothetical protein
MPDKNVSDIVNAIRGRVPDKAIPWIVAQSAHETGVWKSNVFKKLNNGFGMLHPRQRKTTSIGPGSRQPQIEGGGNYATYNNLSDSAKDLLLYFDARKINWDEIDNATEYVAWLKSKGYFGADQTQYTNAVLKFIKKIKIPTAIPIVGVALLAIGILLYLKK